MSSSKDAHQLELMQTIFGIISIRELSIDQQIEEILKAGCSLFGEQISIVSRIEGGNYYIEHVHAPGFDIYKGQKFDLKDTFCSIMVSSEKPLSIADVKSSDYRKHPCTEMGPESYIGMSITVEGHCCPINFPLHYYSERASGKQQKYYPLAGSAENAGNP